MMPAPASTDGPMLPASEVRLWPAALREDAMQEAYLAHLAGQPRPLSAAQSCLRRERRFHRRYCIHSFW